jgi:hypothetical protein
MVVRMHAHGSAHANGKHFDTLLLSIRNNHDFSLWTIPHADKSGSGLKTTSAKPATALLGRMH